MEDDDKDTKDEVQASAEPVLDRSRDQVPEVREERPLRGELLLPYSGGRLRLAGFEEAFLSIVLPSDPDDKSVALKNLVESVIPEINRSQLARILNDEGMELLVSTGLLVPRVGTSRIDAEDEHKSAFKDLIDNGIVAEAAESRKHRYWTIQFDKFALTLVPCDDLPVNGWTGYLPLETALSDIRKQVEEVQNARLSIDAQRSAWLHNQAEPLLKKLHDLSDASFPEAMNQEIAALRDSLHNDAYYLQQELPPDIIDAVDSGDWADALQSIRSHLSLSTTSVHTLFQKFLNNINKAAKANQSLFPTLEQKREFALELQTVLDRLGLRFCCTDCSQPSVLIVRGNRGEGRFCFQHSDGKRHHERVEFPELRLTEQLPTRRRTLRRPPASE